MKKSSKGILFFWIVIAAAAAGGTFLLAEHLGTGGATSGGGMAPSVTPDGTAPPAAQTYADMEDNISTSSGAVAPVAMQNFSNATDGYSFSVPATWNIEKTGPDTVAVHPDASSSVAMCKIELSAFPYSAGADGMADWIAHRIGADPTVAIAEQSSEDVALAGGATGVEWIGTFDSLPTTLVYAFNAAHAYEIAPSVVGVGADGDVRCDGMLQSFLSTLTI